MLDVRECCRLCIKQKQPLMKECADDPVSITIRDIFGIELVVNGPLSTKICRECSFKVLDINLFRNTVQSNQTSLEEYRILQESLQLNPSEIKSEENDDDVILVKYEAPNSNTLEQPEKNIKNVKPVNTEIKPRTLPEKRPLSPVSVVIPKNIKLKKLKVLCQAINLKDISQFRLTERDKRILKLNEKKVESQKISVQFKEIEQKTCETTKSLAAKNLISNIACDSKDKDNNDDTITIVKDFSDKFVKSSETTNVTISNTSRMSTPQNVASMSSLTIPPPTPAPAVKVAASSNIKQYGAKNTFIKQQTSTPLLTQMAKRDIPNFTPRNLNQPDLLNQLKLVVKQPKMVVKQPKMVVNQPKLAQSQPKPANLPRPANQSQRLIFPKPANLPEPINQIKPISQLKPSNQLNNNLTLKTTQNCSFYANVNATKTPPTNTKLNIQPIPAGFQIRSVESPAKVIVPANIPVLPVTVNPNVSSASPPTNPKKLEQNKISKLFIYGGKIFDDKGDCLGAAGNSLKYIQELAQANGNTFTFKVSQSEAQKWQNEIFAKGIAPVPGTAKSVPIAGTTVTAISETQIPSVSSTVAASPSVAPIPVQLISVSAVPRPHVIQLPEPKPTSSRPTQINPPGISPDSNFCDSIADTRVKVLSVNELNNKLNAGSDTRKLPIRITLVKIKDEVQFKLTDSKNCEIHFSSLTAQENMAVRASLLQPSSQAQILSAIRSCKPDKYSEEMLQAFGICVANLKQMK